MDLNLTIDSLVTVGGLAIVIELLMQLVLKPSLAGSEGASWYAISLNVCGFVIAWILSTLGHWVLVGLTPEAVLSAFLTALGATAVAVLGYEVVKNVRTAKNGT